MMMVVSVHDFASFVSSSRNSNRDDDQAVSPRPEPLACRDERPKSSAWARGRLTKKKMRELLITGIFPAMNLFFITVLN